MKPLTHVSFSQLAMFSRCPRAWKLKYIDRIPGSNNLPAAAGSALHSAIEIWERDQTQSLVTLARDLLRDTPEVKDLTSYGAQDLRWWLRTGLAVRSKQYTDVRIDEEFRGYRWRTRDPRSSIEVPLEVKLADDLPILRGYIDQVYYDSKKRLAVRDVKSGKEKGEHALQLQVYDVAWKLLHPDEPFAYGQILYVNGGETVNRTVVPLTLGVQDIAEMVRALATTTHYLTAGPFTGACVHCDYRSLCPVGQVEASGVLALKD